MKDYIPRLIDKILQEKLNLYGAVLLEGCKWCGKSTTAKQIAKSVLELQNPKTHHDSLELIDTKPDMLLSGDKPRLIDEWQDIPAIWDAVRYDVDKSNLVNQYILTGSATPAQEKPRHSGIGRIMRLTMRPMSLAESGESTGEVSLAQLFESTNSNKDISGQSNLDLDQIAYLCARGGWPAAVVRSTTHGDQIARDYLDALIHNDISSVGIALHNASKMGVLLRSLARNIATPVSFNTILRDTEGQEVDIAGKATVSTYISALEQLHIMDDVPAWSPLLRSKTEIRSSKKRNFADPSLAVAALYASGEDLLGDIRTFGLIFESLALRDLKTYMQNLGGEVFYYRDSYGLECDAILHRLDGTWGAVEIKLGSSVSINEGAKTLLKLRETVDLTKMKEPAFLMVLTAASQYAYRRKEDGILVVPIGCLGA